MAITHTRIGNKYEVKADSGADTLSYRIVSLSRPTPSDWQKKTAAGGAFIFDCLPGEVTEVTDPTDGSRALLSMDTGGAPSFLIHTSIEKKGRQRWRIAFDTACSFAIDGSHLAVRFGEQSFRFCGPINDRSFFIGRDPNGCIRLDEYAGKLMTLIYC